MTYYSLALFFHFLGLAMLFVGYGLEWIVSAFLRGATALLRAPGLPTLIRVRAMMALGIVYLMTVKPDTFFPSLLALGAAIVLGLLASAPTFSKSKTA